MSFGVVVVVLLILGIITHLAGRRWYGARGEKFAAMRKGGAL